MGNDEQLELFDELHRRSALLPELDAPRIEGFVSGFFAVWDTVDDEIAFVAFCRDRPGPVSALLCAALVSLGDPATSAAARRAFDSMSTDAPAAAGELGRSSPVAAWSVQAPFGRSIVIGCAVAAGDIDHAMLFELDEDEVLVDLQLTGSPAELVDPELTGDSTLEVASLDVADAVALVGRSWRSALGRIEPTPGLLSNQRFARRRLHEADTEEPLPTFGAMAGSIDVSRGMSPEEIAEANTAACNTLRAAVGEPAEGERANQAWVEVVRGAVPGVSPRERDALLWLEWADWLGAGIGLLRHRDRGALDGQVLVDLVNSCPEVSSTIQGADRDYAAWAFDIALEHLADAGLLDDEELTDGGRRSLHPSLLEAWADH